MVFSCNLAISYRRQTCPLFFPLRSVSIAFLFLLILFVSLPRSVQAFWGNNTVSFSSLDLESGYDVNTVTTVTGQILSIQTGAERSNIQLEIEGGKSRMVIFLGPQRYWVEQGLSLQTGDEVVVRGSKAQGQDGVIYILAQEITETSQGVGVVLRDESGFPNWAGGRQGHGGGGSGGNGKRRGGGHGGGR